MKYLLCLILFSFSPILFAQQSTNDTIQYHDSLSLQSIEAKIITLYENVQSAKNELEMMGRNDYLKQFIYQAIKRNDFYYYPFEKLSKLMSTIYSDDKQIRIINWNIYLPNRSTQYFCYLLHKENGKINVTELKDDHWKIRKPGYKKLNEHKWFGALYYQIISQKIKNEKVYYFLGWNGLNGITSNKIIEPVTFNNGSPTFGKLLFYIDNQQFRRIVFEYKSDLAFALRYDAKKNAFIFDHLEPMHESMIGVYEYYISTGVYNAFEYKKGKWIFKHDISMRNNNGGIANQYNKPLSIKEINIKE